jgi:hypothetical protein
METSVTFIKIEGKPLEKLIDTISSAIGVMYTPRKIRNEARAEADRTLIIAEAKAKELFIMDDAQIELAKRAGQRLVHLELIRQRNIEEIADIASENMGETASDIPIDNDWRARFFSKAQDVSSEDLQKIWGKILAEEVTEPGKVSLKTLDVISNLSSREVECFNTACSLSLNDGHLLEMGNDADGNRRYSMPYSDILILMEAGLIHHGALTTTYSRVEPLNGCLLMFGQKGIVCSQDNTLRFKFNNVAFTRSGLELMNVLASEKEYAFIDEFTTYIQTQNMKTTIIRIA